MARRSYRVFRVILPHFILVFTFACYLFLGACGLYFLVFPSVTGVDHDLDEFGGAVQWDTNQGEGDYMEMYIDIPCSEAKRRLEELNRRQFEQITKSSRDQLRKFTFTRAVLICFNWITTIGNRWPGEWEYIGDQEGVIKAGLISRFYPLLYMLLGIPMTFIMLANFSALLYDGLNRVFFGIRRLWHSRMIMSKREKRDQLRKDMEDSRLWNPLWFILLIIGYIASGGALLQFIWSLETPARNPFSEALWNCAVLVLPVGETVNQIFILPSSSWYCLAQICYSILGLIIFGAFLRSFLPLAAKIYTPNPVQKSRQVRRQDITEKKGFRSTERISLMDDGVSVTRMDSQLPQIQHRTIPSPPRSILRQRNGTFSFEPKRSNSLESMESEDLLASPMVRFNTMTMPVDSRAQRQRILTQERPQGTRNGGTNGSFTDIHGSMVFHVSPDSIPFADQRTSTLIM